MLARLLSLTAALLLTIACGRADANALHPKTAHRGFAAIAATASGQIALASLEAIKEKVAAAGDRTSSLLLGEQLSPSTALGYHRARWLAFDVGRFTQMDEFLGVDRKPITLAKYLYANANPVSFRDPSGHMFMTEQGIVSKVMGTLNLIAHHAIMGATRHPFLSLGMSVLFNAMLPNEFQVPMPMNFGPSLTQGLSSATKPVLSTMAKELTFIQRNFVRLGGKFTTDLGNRFEDTIRVALGARKNIAKAQVRIDGVLTRCVEEFVDWRSVLEIKAQASSLRKKQFQCLALHALENGRAFELVFYKQPSPDDYLRMQRWLDEALDGAELPFSINYFYR